MASFGISVVVGNMLPFVGLRFFEGGIYFGITITSLQMIDDRCCYRHHTCALLWPQCVGR